MKNQDSIFETNTINHFNDEEWKKFTDQLDLTFANFIVFDKKLKTTKQLNKKENIKNMDFTKAFDEDRISHYNHTIKYDTELFFEEVPLNKFTSTI